MKALDCLKNLIAFKTPSSVSNAEISDYVEQTLKGIGFQTERIEYRDDRNELKVNIAARKGSGTGGVAFFGHTDVVPADDWSFPDGTAWEATVTEDRVYGRGSCDMKGPVACTIEAASRFETASLQQPVYIVCTADEEVGYGGARQVFEQSDVYREIVAGQSRTIIAEPTQLEVVYAHKGGICFEVVSHGRAAHSSTREGVNANYAMIPFLAEMNKLRDETESDTKWQNDEFDPPTVCWNLGINDHTGAVNITPPQSVCTVYFRVMPNVDVDELMQRVRQSAERHGLELNVRFQCGAMYTSSDSPFVHESVSLTSSPPPRTVGYGTDGAVFTNLNDKIVFGPGNIAQAHTSDEWIALDQLARGSDMFAKMIQRWSVDVSSV